ncbi:acyltransferase family protein [Pseudomonas atacamensis]|uniref:acyltransferase family protein n=1 Tax=Pseudomonas atacamensis TaxID=2565368 RepID=UPI001FABB91D|nr:acyltransferase [Pseudomonas atacamensis]MCI9875898.1 acyltransferase [Pseudomonas atacamensis]
MDAHKNIDMQCLRAIAVIMVVMQHYKVRLPTTQNYVDMFNSLSLWTGVDVFFALSGFLIYKSINSELAKNQTRKAAAISFSRKRIKRLVPALVLGLFLSIAVSAVSFSSPNHDPLKISTGAIMALLGVSNFYWSACVGGILSYCGNPDFNGVTWSLALEWQLYAATCILICALGNRRAVAIALAASLLLSIWPAPSFSILWVTRSLAFFLGCAIAMLYSQRSFSLPRPTSCCALLTGLALCILSPVYASKDFTLLLIGVGGSLCLLSSISGNLFKRNSLITELFTWIGDRSYSVYLLHLPCILLSRELLTYLGANQNNTFGILCGLVISISLIAITANLSYKFVEQRFIKRNTEALSKKEEIRDSNA